MNDVVGGQAQLAEMQAARQADLEALSFAKSRLETSDASVAELKSEEQRAQREQMLRRRLEQQQVRWWWRWRRRPRR
jgi:hypothetical protein